MDLKDSNINDKSAINIAQSYWDERSKHIDLKKHFVKEIFYSDWFVLHMYLHKVNSQTFLPEDYAVHIWKNGMQIGNGKVFNFQLERVCWKSGYSRD